MARAILNFLDNLCTYVINNFIGYLKAYASISVHEYRSRVSSIVRDYPLAKYKEQITMFLDGTKTLIKTDLIKNINSKPEWLDTEKLKRGQKFGQSYILSINFSNFISLFLLFAHEKSLRPLIFTNKSNDIESAYKRYMSTLHRVKIWFEEDLTDEESLARKHIKIVNSYHCSVTREINSINETEYLNRSKIHNIDFDDYKNYYEIVTKDLEKIKTRFESFFLDEMDKSQVISQSHMLVTQFGFVGLLVLYPHKFGITVLDELDNFIHLWKYIGHLLGIKEKFNLCSGTYEEVRQKCFAVLECVLIPCLRNVNLTWEHMSLCAFLGVNKAFNDNLEFEVTLAFLIDCIELKYKYLYKSMTFKYKVKLFLTKFIFRYLMRIKLFRLYVNKRFLKALNNNLIFSRLESNLNLNKKYLRRLTDM